MTEPVLRLSDVTFRRDGFTPVIGESFDLADVDQQAGHRGTTMNVRV